MIGVLFLMIVLIFGSMMYVRIKRNSDIILNENIIELKFEDYDDGKYLGEYYQDTIGVKLEIVIEDHQLISVEYIDHQFGKGQKAESISELFIEKQSLQVDDIGGATISSRCIKLAIINALEEGGN